MVDAMTALRMGRYDMWSNAGANNVTGPRVDAVIGTALGWGNPTGSGIRGGAEVSAQAGRLGLGMLAVLVVGVMAFYVFTKERQF